MNASSTGRRAARASWLNTRTIVIAYAIVEAIAIAAMLLYSMRR